MTTTIKPGTELSPTERRLIAAVALRERYVDFEVSRRSADPYDIAITGTAKMEYIEGEMRFNAWLPLAAIRSVNWTRDAIWSLSDGYGEPGFVPGDYDWSGIRDSTRPAIWEMFDVAKGEILG